MKDFVKPTIYKNVPTHTTDHTVVNSPKERLVMCHSYTRMQGYFVCENCGTAKHTKKYDGFNFWFAGVGYEKEPKCRVIN